MLARAGLLRGAARSALLDRWLVLHAGGVEFARRLAAVFVARDVVAVVNRLRAVSHQFHPDGARDTGPVQVPHSGAPKVVEKAPWQAKSMQKAVETTGN